MRHPALVVSALLILAACTQPPTREVDSARAMVQKAREAGADRYAPDRFEEAQAALDDAGRRLEQKDYRGALSSATDAVDKARVATQAARAAESNARGSVEISRAEIRSSLEGAEAARKQALEDLKVPEEAFSAADARLDESRKALASIEEMVTRGDLLEAQKTAAALQSGVGSLAGQFTAAAQQWREAHPKGRPRGKAPGRRAAPRRG